MAAGSLARASTGEGQTVVHDAPRVTIKVTRSTMCSNAAFPVEWVAAM
jgi:hypothetical protein